MPRTATTATTGPIAPGGYEDVEIALDVLDEAHERAGIVLVGSPAGNGLTTTCYSLIGPRYGISVAAVYRLSEDGKTIAGVKGAGGLTPKDASAEARAREVQYAYSWFDNITSDIFN